MLDNICLIIAQIPVWEDADTKPATPPPAPMNFSDFKQGFRQWNDGTEDNTFRNGLLVVLAIIAVVALVIHFRQRRQSLKTVDSNRRLGRELAAMVPFPFATRWLLMWVSYSAGIPFAALLLSSRLFNDAVNEWSTQSTFGVIRRWGKGRLELLHGVLFEIHTA